MTEAKGFEEMIIESRNSRKEKSVYPKATVLEGKKGQGMSNELGSLIEKAMVLFSPPDHAKFDELYAEANSTNTISSKIEQNMLTILTPKHNLSMDVRTVLEIIAQKMRTPLSLPMEMNLNSAPPFISNIKEICNFWISEMLCEYQKIFRLNDPMIQKLCHEYWLSMSYPILVRLAYTEWENQQMDWKVGLKVKDIAVEFAAKNREVKNDYDKLLEEKTTAMKTRMNRTEMENRELNTMLSVKAEQLNNLKQDEANRVGEVEDSYNKLKDEKARVSLLEKEIIRLKDENKTLREQVKKDEDEAGWKPDVTSTPELPVYRNKELKETLAFPVSMERFKKEYKLKSQKDNLCRYETEDGKVFELPDSLADDLVDSESGSKSSKNKKVSETASIKLKENKKWQEIVSSIIGYGDGGATGKDIANDVNVNSTNIRRDYLNEMEEEGIIRGEKIGKEKRYKVTVQ